MGKNITGFLKDRYVWIVLSVSLTVRIYMGFFTYVIQNDSVAFMQNAQYFAHGDFQSGLIHPYHPMYSLLMAGLYKIVPNMELSGTVISVFLGTLTVVVFYLIGRDVFNQKISFVSSLILAFHPYAVRLSAAIISDSTYLFFFLTATGFGFFAITNGRLLLFALTGVCSALAYLTRPEGIGIICIVAGWCLLKDCFKMRIVWKQRFFSITVLVISFLVFASPYLVYMRSETGVWILTKKRNFSQNKTIQTSGNLSKDGLVRENLSKRQVSGGNSTHNTVVNEANENRFSKKPEQKKSDTEREGHKDVKFVKIPAQEVSLKTYLKSIIYIITKYLDTYHPILVIFLIFGVINWEKIRMKHFFGFYVTTIIVFYLVILYRLNIVNIEYLYGDNQYPSRRHLMPIIIPAVFFAGTGVYKLGICIYEKFKINRLKSGFREIFACEWTVQLLVLIIVIAALLPKTLKPQGVDKVGVKKAGHWIKENSDKPLPVIVSASSRIAYYAKGKVIQMGGIDDALTIAREEKADYLLLTDREHQAIEKQLQQSIMKKEIVLVYKVQDESSFNGDMIFLYKMLY